MGKRPGEGKPKNLEGEKEVEMAEQRQKKGHVLVLAHRYKKEGGAISKQRACA